MSLPDGYHAVRLPVPVTVNQPLPGEAVRTFTAALLGGTFDRGTLLHYRVRDGEGVIWFVPPHWTSPAVDRLAWEAGVPLAEMRPGAWLDRIQAVERASQRPGWPLNLFPPGHHPAHQPPRKPTRQEEDA